MTLDDAFKIVEGVLYHRTRRQKGRTRRGSSNDTFAPYSYEFISELLPSALCPVCHSYEPLMLMSSFSPPRKALRRLIPMTAPGPSLPLVLPTMFAST